ncbi:hypothetical protein [Iningainema tapete]|uniref:Uncharacterized protein n=1 Tax=Iningainema tapete BLCC-T55 TaxID=2748662 RepID=A0A8J6XGP6_9CYAN|nr:hypothetical protein [Iningainema tapete]MBD2773933.1 hypothetical protein [Iningainema tapete BLCC-T55]
MRLGRSPTYPYCVTHNLNTNSLSDSSSNLCLQAAIAQRCVKQVSWIDLTGSHAVAGKGANRERLQQSMLQ